MVSAPPERWPHVSIRGVIHVAWQHHGTTLRTMCFLEADEWTFPDIYNRPPLTCFWCLTGRVPGLHWRYADA